MDWAKAARNAYLAIGGEYQATRTRPLPVADLADFGERALDVGSGRGAQPLYFERQHRYVVHCDLDRRLTPGGDSVECEANLLPFRDGAFDVAYLVAVLHHMPKEAAAVALREAKRVAAAAVATVWRPDRGREVAPGVWEVPWGRRAARLYYVHRLEELAELAGVRPISLGLMKRGRHHNFYILV
ncbi:MAG: class I SAM-dependent methyltransferase [Pyrobaculum sp.]